MTQEYLQEIEESLNDIRTRALATILDMGEKPIGSIMGNVEAIQNEYKTIQSYIKDRTES